MANTQHSLDEHGRDCVAHAQPNFDFSQIRNTVRVYGMHAIKQQSGLLSALIFMLLRTVSGEIIII